MKPNLTPNVPRGEQGTDKDSGSAYTVEADGLDCEICLSPFGDQIFMVSTWPPLDTSVRTTTNLKDDEVV